MSTDTLSVEIDAWEYVVLLLYVAIIGTVYANQQVRKARHHPEFRYYSWGLVAKVIGGVLFTLTYLFYYGNGDTLSYFQTSVVLSKLAMNDLTTWTRAMLMDNTLANYYQLFNNRTGYPMEYVYLDDPSYALAKFTSLLAMLAGNSILLTVAMVGTVAYGGVWRFYRMLVRRFPSLSGELAFAVLFFPSVVFWGSGIMKDTFTFTGLCWFIYAVDKIFFLKRDLAWSWIVLLVASYVMVTMKPYVFMMIVPAGLLWVLYFRVTRLRNSFMRLFLLPIGVLVVGTLAFVILSKLEGSLGKYSLGQALDTIMLTQADLKRSEQYGSNYFDLGNIEATWASVFSKFPQAVFAGLYRPALPEVNNVVMLLTALENTFLLLMTLYILFRSRVVFLFTLILQNPMLQMFYLFSISYAFMIAITTPNFGAMVRFKIPLLPLFVAALFITKFILDRRAQALRQGRPFKFKSYENGEPRVGAVVTAAGKRRMAA